MEKIACLLAVSLLLILENAALAQGDPVAGPAPVVVTPQPTQVTPQGPSFTQIIQQQQQIQNVQLPAYLQTNTTVSPLDQRSGLAGDAIKTINLAPTGLAITTVKVPNVVNDTLLAPTTTVTQPTTNSLKLDFSKMGPLFDSLQKLYGTPQTVPTTTTIIPVNPQPTTVTTTVIPVNKPATKDFLSELTDQFFEFANLKTPQDRQKSLLDMGGNFTKLLKLGLLPESARDDLNKLAEIANNPNHPSIKTQDATTARFYISNILQKLSTNLESVNVKGISLAAINAPDNDSFKIINDIKKSSLEAREQLIATAEGKIQKHEDPLDKATKAVSNAASVVVAAITTGGGAPASARAMPVQKQTSISTQTSLTQQGSAAAAAPKQDTTTQKSTPQAPPQAPVVDTAALQNSLNTATNALGDLNTRLESKVASLATITSAIAKSTPTATNKQQLDMYKSQQQRLQAEVNTLKSDKAVAQNNFLTSYAKIYGSTAANILSSKIGSTNPDTKTLQSLMTGH